MAQTFFPFDAGAGANSTEDQWTLMAQEWLGTGVIKNDPIGELAVSANASGMQVFVAAGKAWVQGHFFQSDAQVTLAIAANASGNPRIDRVVVQLDKVANTVSLVVLQGTPAVTPVAPALTQTFNLWQISLARVAVANGAVNIAAGNVTDERVYATAQTDRLEFSPAGASAAPDTFVKRAPAGGLVVTATPAAAVNLAVQATVAQTGDLFRALDNSGSPLLQITTGGLLVANRGANVIGNAPGSTTFYVNAASGQSVDIIDVDNNGSRRLSLTASGTLQLPTGDLFAQYTSVNQVRVGTVGGGAAAGVEFGNASTEWMGNIAANLIGLAVGGNIKVKFDTSGNLITTGNNGTGMTFSGSGVIALHNAGTNPFTTPTQGGVLYASAGALHWRGTAGTDTTIAVA